MVWRADMVQAVVFTQPGQPQPDALKLWTRLFPDDSPDNFQRPAAAPTSITSASGARNGYNVGINAQIGRVDILLNGGAPSGPGEAPKQIEDFESAIVRASEFAALVSAEAPPIRLALVLQVSQTVEREHAAVALSEAIGRASFPSDGQDLIYQFNVKRQIVQMPALALNRILTWTSGEHQFFSFTLGPNSNPLAIEARPFVGFKIDVNTVGSFVPDVESVKTILSEITNEILLSAREGSARFE